MNRTYSSFSTDKYHFILEWARVQSVIKFSIFMSVFNVHVNRNPISGVVLKKQGRDIRRFEWNALSLLSPRSLEVTPRTDTQGQPPGLQSQKVGSGGCWGKLGLLKASILKLFWGSLRHPSPQLVSFVRKLFWGQLSMTFKIYPGLLIWLLTYHARI